MLRRKYKKTNFSVPIKKILGNGKIIACRLEYIDSFRFMSTSVSSLVVHLKFTARNVEIKITNLTAISLSLKIIIYIKNAKKVKRDS